MTKEQEEAIERLKRIDVKFFISGMNEVSNYIIDEADKVNNAIETVLSMLKEKDKEIERLRYIKKSFDYVVQKETEKKNRQIDLMAEEINETDRGYTDYCEMKIECDRNCKDCIKRYYERKSEK